MSNQKARWPPSGWRWRATVIRLGTARSIVGEMASEVRCHRSMEVAFTKVGIVGTAAEKLAASAPGSTCWRMISTPFR